MCTRLQLERVDAMGMLKATCCAGALASCCGDLCHSVSALCRLVTTKGWTVQSPVVVTPRPQLQQLRRAPWECMLGAWWHLPICLCLCQHVCIFSVCGRLTYSTIQYAKLGTHDSFSPNGMQALLDCLGSQSCTRATMPCKQLER